MLKGAANSDLTTRFSDFAERECNLERTGRYLLAVSGGLDSVVLCHLMNDLKYDFQIAHCNFGLRGEESDRDEAFVGRLADSLGVEAHFKTFDTSGLALLQRISTQEAARDLRYAWFGEFLSEDRMSPEVTGGSRKPMRVLTAHHADDNIETLLMNLFKGTGIAGLRGMLPDNGRILRPLLFAFREELEDYGRVKGLEWVEDSSNRKVKYTRNRVRLQLMPLIEEIFPQARRNLASGILHFRDAEILQTLSLKRIREKLCERQGESLRIPVEKLRKTPAMRSVLFDILKDFGFKPGQTDEALALMDAHTGRYISSHSHRLLRNRAWLVVSPMREAEEETAVIEKTPSKARTTDGTFQVTESPEPPMELPADNPLVAFLDARQIRFPLLLRRWRKGDYFYPLGMPKKKKVARFLIDRKLSMDDKQRVWVLESDLRILWVVGMRIDDRFKVVPSSKRILRLEWKPVVT